MARIPFELKGKTVFVAGHKGMVGAALMRRLADFGVDSLITDFPGLATATLGNY